MSLACRNLRGEAQCTIELVSAIRLGMATEKLRAAVAEVKQHKQKRIATMTIPVTKMVGAAGEVLSRTVAAPTVRSHGHWIGSQSAPFF